MAVSSQQLPPDITRVNDHNDGNDENDDNDDNNDNDKVRQATQDCGRW